MLADTLLHYDIHSEGMLLFNARTHDHGVDANMQLQDATVRLPQTLNFIHDGTAQCEIDIALRKIIIRQAKGALHTGTFSIAQGVIWFDEHNAIKCMHIPLLINHCYIYYEA